MRLIRTRWPGALKLVAATVIGAGLATAGLWVGGLLEFDNSEASSSVAPSTISEPVEVSIVDEEPAKTTTTNTEVEYPNQIFVSPNGVDEHDRGRSPERPVLTPDFAIELSASGSTIHFASGSYPSLLIREESEITIEGPDDGSASFSSGAYDNRAGIRVDLSTGIRLINLKVVHSLWGILITSSSNVIVENSDIRDVGQEGIMIRANSRDVAVYGTFITETGQRPGLDGEVPFSNYGEGIYLGTGGKMPDGGLDETSDIRLEGNEISFTSAEAIDVKSSVIDVVIFHNVIHDIATANSGAIVVGIGRRLYPDPRVVIERNILFGISRTSPWTDGNAITLSAPAVVRDNVIFDVQHHGIFVDDNLSSAEPGEVLIENNLVISTGLEPIQDSSTQLEIPIRVVVERNYIGEEAERLADGFDPAAPKAFGDAMLALIVDR